MNKKICTGLVAILLLYTAIHSADSTSQTATKLRIMTYNVCNSAEVQRSPELYQKLSWAVRKERIFKHILHEQPDIIGFQEVRNEPGSSAVADLWAGLGKHGYEIVTFRNNPSELAAINAIAYKFGKLALDKTDRWWVSETPEKFSDSWGNGWGSVALMATFYPTTTENIRGQMVASPNYAAAPIHTVNIHHGLKHAERMHANRILVEQIQNKTAEQAGVIVITGDFNNFPHDGGAQELQLLTDAGYQDGLSALKTAEGIQLSGTFIGFSYDKFKCPVGKLDGHLDHIWVKALANKVSCDISGYISLKKFNGNDRTDAHTEAELLMNADGQEVRDEFCSDHAAGVVDITINAPH